MVSQSIPHKHCVTCKELKPLIGFHKNRTRKNGLQNECKDCRLAYGRKRDAKPEMIIRRKERWHKKQFGLTAMRYSEMLAEQDGKCAICGYQPAPDKRALAIDHDHKTGKVRSLLCGPCNRGIGQFRERADLLILAAEYLESHNSASTSPALAECEKQSESTACNDPALRDAHSASTSKSGSSDLNT
jgi:hypothetical protein